MITPQGFHVTQAYPGFPRIGAHVSIVAQRGLVMDWPYRGRRGNVLGYTLPHGFAVVDSDGDELLVHPESLGPVQEV